MHLLANPIPRSIIRPLGTDKRLARELVIYVAGPESYPLCIVNRTRNNNKEEEEPVWIDLF